MLSIEVMYDISRKIEAIVFITTLFIMLNRLGYKNKKPSLSRGIIAIALMVMVFIMISKSYSYGLLFVTSIKEFAYTTAIEIIISVLILSYISNTFYDISVSKSFIESFKYVLIYIVLHQVMHYGLLFILIISIYSKGYSSGAYFDVIRFFISNLVFICFICKLDKIRELYNNKKIYFYIIIGVILNILIFIFLKISTNSIYDLYSVVTDNEIHYEHNILQLPFTNFMDSTLPYIIFIINISFISMLINQLKATKNESKVKLMNEKIDMQYSYYMKVQDSQEKVKKLHHDINNHIINIKYLQNNNKDIQNYIENITDELKDFEEVYSTKNMLLDTILNEKSEICKTNGIEFICDINFSKCEFMKMIDITSIFSNLLDNAIEACNKIENKDKKYISIRGTIIKKYYVIKCENSKVNEVIVKNNKFITSKKDKEKHGIGIESIKSSLKKYGGDLKIRSDEGKFIATIHIPIE